MSYIKVPHFKITQQKLLHYGVLLLLIYLVVFLKLDAFHMRWWDESMFAVNTYEMIQNGKLFSLYFDGVPDLFNTKPPLTVWLQVACVKLLGYNELAIRLPSAIAAAITILLLFDFVAKYFNRIWAWICAMVLLTSQGFIGFHTGRTGDSDAVLTLFLFLANIHFLKYLLFKKNRYIVWFWIFITLAFTTKLYAAFLFVPAYIFLLFKYKSFQSSIFNLSFLLGLISFILLVSGLIYFREIDSPGYISTILKNDAGRILHTLDGHEGSFMFYFNALIGQRFAVWFIPMTAGAFLIFFQTTLRHKKLLSCCIFLVASYLIVISLSFTKLVWYDMPIYPYLALIASYPIYMLVEYVQLSDKGNSKFTAIWFMALVFLFPYYTMFGKSQSNRIPDGQKAYEGKEVYLFNKISDGKNLDGLLIFNDDYLGSLLFYKYKLQEKNQRIKITGSTDFILGNNVLISRDKLFRIEDSYQFTVLDSTEFVKVLHVDAYKIQ